MRRLTVRTAGRFTVESSVIESSIIEFERLTVERLAERFIVERLAVEKNIAFYYILFLNVLRETYSTVCTIDTEKELIVK